MKSYEEAVWLLAKEAYHSYRDGEFSPLTEPLYNGEMIAWIYNLPFEEVKEDVIARYKVLIGATNHV